MKVWLENHLHDDYSNEYNIQVIIPDSNLSKIAIKSIKSIDGYNSFDFKPDVLGILSDKHTGKTELVFLNRSVSAISLKEIGELFFYSKLAQPIQSFIVSSKGLPNEVNLLLLNEDIEKRLLQYSNNGTIIIFRWDVESDSIDPKSIFPLNERKMEHK